jgi:hypothetical protein
VNKTAVIVVWSSSDDCSDADFAILEIDPEYARRLQQRLDLAGSLKAQDESLHALTFWSGLPTFISRESLPDELANQVEDEELVVLDHSLVVPEDAAERVECVQAVVTPEDIYWEALVKHTSIRLETAPIPRAALEEIARQGASGRQEAT